MSVGEENKKTLQERLSVLPPEAAGLITSGQMDKMVEQVQASFQLNPVQAARLSDEVVMTMLFFKPVAALNGNIAAALGIENDKATQIANQINQKVFTPHQTFYSEVDELRSQNTNMEQEPQIPENAPSPKEDKVVSSVRTMSGDMKKYEPTNDKTYTSTQAAILKEGESSG